MSRSSFADLVNSNRLILDGLTTNAERVQKRGITTEFLAEYQSVFDDVRNTDSAQAALKARLKEKTDELRIKVNEMERIYREAKRLIKVEFPQVSWKEFGIEDER